MNWKSKLTRPTTQAQSDKIVDDLRASVEKRSIELYSPDGKLAIKTRYHWPDLPDGYSASLYANGDVIVSHPDQPKSHVASLSEFKAFLERPDVAKRYTRKSGDPTLIQDAEFTEQQNNDGPAPVSQEGSDG